MFQTGLRPGSDAFPANQAHREKLVCKHIQKDLDSLKLDFSGRANAVAPDRIEIRFGGAVPLAGGPA